MKKWIVLIFVLTVGLGLLVYLSVMLSLPEEESKHISDMVVTENGIPWLILPISNQKVNIDHQEHYLEVIDPAMLRAAEEKLLDQFDDYRDKEGPVFHLSSHDGQIWLCMELIVHKDPPSYPTDPSYTGPIPPQEGCGIDHDHLTFSEAISDIS